MKRYGVVPNLLTLGNAVCGFLAIVYISESQFVEGTYINKGLKIAGWLILFGMFCDVFDGALARFTGTAGQLGAQLDSLADLVTFGVAPALLVVKLNLGMRSSIPQLLWEKWEWVVWCFSAAFFLGAVLRLARFNVEQDEEVTSHLAFKGLPTPAAAGTIASLVIFHFYVAELKKPELLWVRAKVPEEIFQPVAQWINTMIPFILPAVALGLGYAMVTSRLRYLHVGSRILKRQSFEGLVGMVFGGILVVSFAEIAMVLLFPIYVLATPVLGFVRLLRRQPDPFGEISS